MRFLKSFRLLHITLLIVLLVSTGYAQGKVDLNQPIPFDSKVKMGELPNKVKFFIRKNTTPEKRAELRLVINAGSVLEDDDQQGLAHFVEHMCFNGTKNFPKNELINYFQTVGVKFGAHVNAYTSFDETVYMLTVPTDKQDVMDKSFQVLEDWAHNVTFDNAEIDKERGVVIEEWRTRLGANQRISDKTLPIILKGSKYAERLPIGKKEILESFKYETIKKFYHDWYRPDLMSVIVVGDVDVDAVEAKIKALFGSIPPTTNPKPRPVYDIPDNKEMLVALATDKEAFSANIGIRYKQPVEKVVTVGDYRQNLVHSLFTGMLNRRLREITQMPNPPFTFGFSFYGKFFRSKNAYTMVAGAKVEDAEKALKTLLTENRRVQEHGFSEAELENYKKEFITQYEDAYNNRNKTESTNLTFGYVDGVLNSEPSPDIEWEYNSTQKMLPTIKVAEINALAKRWLKDDNQIISISNGEKAGVVLPAESAVHSLFSEIATAKTTPYAFKEVSTPLMATQPTPGKLLKEVSLDKIGATELTLSNGVKVIVKSTTFKDDEIQMSAFSLGGASLVSDQDALSAQVATQIISQSGVGGLSQIDLEKVLTGKNVSVSPFIGNLTQGVQGNSAVKDFETMLQLTNLYFTQPRKDETAFNIFISQQKAFLENILANPNFYYFSELSKILSQNHPRGSRFPTAADLEKVNLDRAFQIYQDRFADANNFHFIFVGNLDLNTAKPLLEKYLGSLPTKNRNENFKDLGVRPPQGVLEREFRKGKDPKSQVAIIFANDLQNDQDGFLIESLAQSLTIKLIEVLREEKGGVYGTSANAQIEKFPYEHYSVSINFTCAPENVESLTKAAYEQIRKVQQQGPTAADLNKVKEAQKRDLEKNQRENGYWLNTIRKIYFEKKDLNEFTADTLTKKIEALSVEDLQKAAQKYLDFDNRIVVVMDPETKTKAVAATETK